MKKKIDLQNYKRKELFEAFKDRDIPYFATSVNIDITNLKGFIDQHKCGFFVSISFLISKSINLVPEFRHRIIDGELYEFSRVDPGYTVLMADETFSFCDSRHFDNFKEYREYATARIAEIKTRPDRNVGEKSHMFFISNVPWLSFTSVVHPYFKQYNSIPIITVGKYFAQGDQLLIPVALQANHALADAIHTGRFYSHLAGMCQNPASSLM